MDYMRNPAVVVSQTQRMNWVKSLGFLFFHASMAVVVQLALQVVIELVRVSEGLGGMLSFFVFSIVGLVYIYIGMKNSVNELSFKPFWSASIVTISYFIFFVVFYFIVAFILVLFGITPRAFILLTPIATLVFIWPVTYYRLHKDRVSAWAVGNKSVAGGDSSRLKNKKRNIIFGIFGLLSIPVILFSGFVSIGMGAQSGVIIWVGIIEVVGVALLVLISSIGAFLGKKWSDHFFIAAALLAFAPQFLYLIVSWLVRIVNYILVFVN